MSFLERFKARQVVSPQVEVELALGSTKAIFKFARFSQFEREKARKISHAELRREELNPEDLPAAGLTVAYFAALGAMLKDHVKGWTFLDGTEIPFSKENITLLWQEMSEGERTLLGVGYIRALEEDPKKKASLKDLQELLQTSLSDDLNMSLDSQPSTVESVQPMSGKEDIQSPNVGAGAAVSQNLQ